MSANAVGCVWMMIRTIDRGRTMDALDRGVEKTRERRARL